MDLSPFQKKEDIAKEIKFGIKQFYNKAMQKGNELEDYVRELANQHFSDSFQPKVGRNGEYLASLDGLNFEGDTIIEIKVSEKTYEDLKEGIIPKNYYAQLQHQLLVFDNVKRAFLIAYSEKEDKIIVSREVTARLTYQSLLEESWQKFDEFLKDYELPKIKEIEDKQALELATELNFLEKMIKELQEKANAKKAELLETIKEDLEENEKLKVANATISKRTGAKKIDYKGFLAKEKLEVPEEFISYGASSTIIKFN